MRILLISPSSLNTGEWTIPHLDGRGNMPPLGILVLREIIGQDHEVRMLVYDYAVNDIKQILKEAAKSDVTGFSVCSPLLYPATREIVRKLKQEEVDTKVVLGGVFPTYHAQYLCEDGIDIIVCGDGEIAFPHLLETLETERSLDHVQGLTFRKGDEIIDTGFAPLADLNEVPIPCYDRLPLTEARYDHISCETSRGCWNDCSFCAIYSRRRWRGCTPEKSLALMERAHKYMKYSQRPYISLADSNFSGSIKRIKRIADLVENETPLQVPMRLDSVNKNTIKYFQKIGLKAAIVGIESASKSMLASINKNLDIDTAEKRLQLLIDHGIIPRATFMLGLPGEDKNSAITTVKYIRHLVEWARENIRISVLPYRLDVATTPAEFENFKSMEAVRDFLVSTHSQKFRLWVLALAFLADICLYTLGPREQITMLHELIENSPETTIELAKSYDGNIPPLLLGFQRYLRLNGNK